MARSESPLKKRRRRSIIAFELIRLDRTATEPLHEQLYREIRDELKSCTFTDGGSKPAFVFGFTGWTPAQIRESLTKLASALEKAGSPRT
jgi:hypothetical protein